MREKIKQKFVSLRDKCREGRRPLKGVLVRSRTTAIPPHDIVEDHIRGSVERLDTQVSTLHQDVTMLSYEVINKIKTLQFLPRVSQYKCYLSPTKTITEIA